MNGVTLLSTIASSALGALFAAYFGTTWALRKHRGVYAFERRLMWTEEAFATLEKLQRSLGSVDSDLLAATASALTVMNRCGLYATPRAIEPLNRLGDAILELRAVLNKQGSSDTANVVRIYRTLTSALNDALDVLSYDVREQLGLASETDHLNYLRRKIKRGKVPLPNVEASTPHDPSSVTGSN